MKRQIFAEWTLNYNPTIYYIQETHFKYNDTEMLQEGEKRHIMQTLNIKM